VKQYDVFEPFPVTKPQAIFLIGSPFGEFALILPVVSYPCEWETLERLVRVRQCLDEKKARSLVLRWSQASVKKWRVTMTVS
jgi:hypothetical protein